MKWLTTLLLILCITGCTLISPPGDVTKNVTQEQMTVLLDSMLKPGMPLKDALAILKKEDFQCSPAEETAPGKGTIYCWRSEQESFWIERDWKVFLEYHDSKLTGYSMKAHLIGP